MLNNSNEGFCAAESVGLWVRTVVSDVGKVKAWAGGLMEYGVVGAVGRRAVGGGVGCAVVGVDGDMGILWVGCACTCEAVGAVSRRVVGGGVGCVVVGVVGRTRWTSGGVANILANRGRRSPTLRPQVVPRRVSKPFRIIDCSLLQ